MNVVGRYKSLIWWTMDLVGVSRSVWWKVLMAVGIQFGVSVALALVPLLFAGWLRLGVTLSLFALALVAFGNTVLIVREDIVGPLLDLQATSSAIAEGEIDVEPPTSDQTDEIGQLVHSFEDMCDHLDVVAAKASALENQEFDAPALKGDVPGQFGDSFDKMAASLERYIDRIEADRDRFQLLNYLVGHDIPNIISVVYGRIDALRMVVDDPEAIGHIDIIEEQTEEIEVISNTVGQLASEKSLFRTDVVEMLERAFQRTQDSFPHAQVVTDLPDEQVYVRGNELLTRVFENLVTNAIEHNDADEPEVTVSLAEIDGVIEIRVADDGPGLDVDDATSFFESLKPGTGLNIVYTVVRRFGGDVEIEASERGGTTFVVTLPLMDRADGQTAADRTGKPRISPE